MSEKRPCPRCDGCGEIATDDEGTPWSQWEALPPGSKVAVALGLVQPIPCPACGGTGWEKICHSVVNPT